MIRMLSTLLALTAALASSGTFAASLPSTAANVDEVRQVMTNFQSALQKKDSAALHLLFLNDAVPVTGVASDKTIARVRAKKADAAKVLPSTSGKFIESIVTDKALSQEKFSNISVNGDGAIASVYFDFVFESDGNPENVGSESWLLVRTDHGWKISAIVYSMNFPEKES